MAQQVHNGLEAERRGSGPCVVVGIAAVSGRRPARGMSSPGALLVSLQPATLARAGSSRPRPYFVRVAACLNNSTADSGDRRLLL